MIKGYVDVLSNKEVYGWCLDISSPEEKLLVKVFYNNTEIGASTANLYREDLKSVWQSGDFAFHIVFAQVPDVNKIRIVIINPHSHELSADEAKSKYVSHDEWECSLKDELDFWELMFAESPQLPQDAWISFRERFSRDRNFPMYLRPYVTHNSRVLDIGSGPVSTLPAHAKDIDIKLTCVDPLADKYVELYCKYGRYPDIYPIVGSAENLTNVDGMDFDLIYSGNAIDHTINPLLAIQGIVDFANLKDKRGKTVIFVETFVNTALENAYMGLHKWNLMPCDNDLIIWNRDICMSLKKRLSGYNEIICKNEGIGMQLIIT